MLRRWSLSKRISDLLFLPYLPLATSSTTHWKDCDFQGYDPDLWVFEIGYTSKICNFNTELLCIKIDEADESLRWE
jgi:hypothetical protein